MGLRKILDDLEPHFTKGGKYESWYALFEAVDTIFYTPSKVTVAEPHVRDGIDLKRVMITVWFAAFLSYVLWHVQSWLPGQQRYCGYGLSWQW